MADKETKKVKVKYKPEAVGIVSAFSDPQGVCGLGGDGKIYWWSWKHEAWVCAPEEDKKDRED